MIRHVESDNNTLQANGGDPHDKEADPGVTEIGLIQAWIPLHTWANTLPRTYPAHPKTPRLI